MHRFVDLTFSGLGDTSPLYKVVLYSRYLQTLLLESVLFLYQLLMKQCLFFSPLFRHFVQPHQKETVFSAVPKLKVSCQGSWGAGDNHLNMGIAVQTVSPGRHL